MSSPCILFFGYVWPFSFKKKKKKERKEKNDDEIVGASMKLSHEIINLLLLCKQKSS